MKKENRKEVVSSSTVESSQRLKKEKPKVVSSSTELELKELIKANCVCGNTVILLGLSLWWVTYLLWGMSVAHAILIMLIAVIMMGSMVSMSWVNDLEMGKGDAVCRMCRYKVVAFFLMLYCHNPSRTIRVLQLLEQEQEFIDSVV